MNPDFTIFKVSLQDAASSFGPTALFYHKRNKGRKGARSEFPQKICNVVRKQRRRWCCPILQLEQLFHVMLYNSPHHMGLLFPETVNAGYWRRSFLLIQLLRSTMPSINHTPHDVDSLLPGDSVSHTIGTIANFYIEVAMFKRTCIGISYVTEPFHAFRKVIGRWNGIWNNTFSQCFFNVSNTHFLIDATNFCIRSQRLKSWHGTVRAMVMKVFDSK